MTQEKITSLFFEGRQYTNRQDGGTYQAVRIYANGKQIGAVSLSYGYGTQYETNALEWMHANGLLSEESSKRPAWMLRNDGVHVYSTLAHGLLKETRIGNYTGDIAHLAPIN